MKKYSPQEIQAITDRLNQDFEASIQGQQSGASSEIAKIVIDLSTAQDRSNPRKISFPMTFVYVEDATDLNTYVRFIPNSSDTIQEDIKLSKRDGYGFEHGTREAYLYWPAQPGKSLVLKFFVSSKFYNGSLLLDQNSTPASVSVGYATGDLDGFTRQIEFRYVAGTGLYLMRDIEQPSANVGTLNVNGAGAASTFWKVPAGYTANIIGLYLNQEIAFDANVGLYLFAMKDGDSYTGDVPLAANSLAYLFTTPPLVGTYNGRLVNSGLSSTKGYIRKGIVAYENEVLTLAATAYTATVGTTSGFFLVRLTRNVGA